MTFSVTNTSVIRNAWAACPSLSSWRPDSQTAPKVMRCVVDFFHNLSWTSIKNSQWTYVVLGSALFICCAYKIRSLMTQLHQSQADLKKAQHDLSTSKEREGQLQADLKKAQRDNSIARNYLTLPIEEVPEEDGEDQEKSMEELVQNHKSQVDFLLEQKDKELLKLVEEDKELVSLMGEFAQSIDVPGSTGGKDENLMIMSNNYPLVLPKGGSRITVLLKMGIDPNKNFREALLRLVALQEIALSIPRSLFIKGSLTETTIKNSSRKRLSITHSSIDAKSTS